MPILYHLLIWACIVGFAGIILEQMPLMPPTKQMIRLVGGFLSLAYLFNIAHRAGFLPGGRL